MDYKQRKRLFDAGLVPASELEWRICEICQTEFPVWPKIHHHQTQNFCSRACGRKNKTVGPQKKRSEYPGDRHDVDRSHCMQNGIQCGLYDKCLTFCGEWKPRCRNGQGYVTRRPDYKPLPSIHSAIGSGPLHMIRGTG